jgi:hypothetical protein
VRHTERFSVGDEVWWHVPTVMDSCRTWAPDISKPTKIIAVKDREGWAVDQVNPCHPQLVRVSPNYCPWGDEFDGSWLLPVGIKSHNDPAFRALATKDTPDAKA